ncbi:MAG: EamA family transporter [Proteobacteria bacterium]|nr:MAG: EamA family transporter [Pseudomonadota bacterium]
MNILQVLMAVSVPLLWGLGFTFSKAALGEFPPLMLMGLRFCLTALILVWFVPFPRGEMVRVVQIALIGSVLQYGLTFTGLSYLDASTAILLVQLEVPFGVLMAWAAFREEVGWIRILGIAVAFFGVALIAGSPSVDGKWFAVALVISGAFVWAVAQVMVKTLKRTKGFGLIAWLAVIAGPLMLIGSFLIEEGQFEALDSATWVGWGTVVYLAVAMTAIGYGVFYKLLAQFPVSMVMPYLLLLPVVGVVGSILILGETLSSRVALGGGVVVAGVAMIELLGRRQRRVNALKRTGDA